MLRKNMAVKDPWVEYFMVGILQMRCSVVTDRTTGDTVIIDGGAEPERIIQWIDEFSGQGPDWTNGPQSFAEMKEMNLPSRKVVALLNTHAHFDHSGHIPDLKERYKQKPEQAQSIMATAKVMMHPTRKVKLYQDLEFTDKAQERHTTRRPEHL